MVPDEERPRTRLVIRQLERPKECASGSEMYQISAHVSHAMETQGRFSDFDRLIHLVRQTPTLDATLSSVKREFTPPNLAIPAAFFHTGPQFAYRLPCYSNVVHTSSIELFFTTLVIRMSIFNPYRMFNPTWMAWQMSISMTAKISAIGPSCCHLNPIVAFTTDESKLRPENPMPAPYSERARARTFSSSEVGITWIPSGPVANKPLVVAIRFALVWRSRARAAAVNEAARLGVPVASRVLVIARRLFALRV